MDAAFEFRLDAPLLAKVTEAAALRGTSIEQFVIDAMDDFLRRPRSRNVREGRFVGRYQGKVYRSDARWRRLVRDVGFLEHRHLAGIRRRLP